MSKKIVNRDSSGEDNGHHYRAAKRIQEQKQERREQRGYRGGRAWNPKPWEFSQKEDDEDFDDMFFE